MRLPIFAIPNLTPVSIKVGLTHGVTVALLILVQSVKVRILMGQQAVLVFSTAFLFPTLQSASSSYIIYATPVQQPQQKNYQSTQTLIL